MSRTFLAAAVALCLVSGCTERSLPSAPRPEQTFTNPSPATMSLRGIIRSIDEAWALEIADGEVVWLIGGPVELYATLLNKEAILVGVYSDGTLIVQSCLGVDDEF